jgi:molybdopterin-binding protein
MNILEATVSGIENSGSLHIVEFVSDKQNLYMMSLELPNVQVGLHVRLAIKPMNIAIAKRFSGSFSFSNKLFATITKIDIGELLCSVKVDFSGQELESIITKRVINDMHLKVGDSVVLFIKASDLFIKEVL